jgi:hypothetical protein
MKSALTRQMRAVMLDVITRSHPSDAGTARASLVTIMPDFAQDISENCDP